MTIGSRIRKRRELLGISQTDLANMVKISKQTLYKYENGIITNIPSDKIEAISNKLDVSASYLMGWTTDEVISMVEKDVALSNMSEKVQEYALKIASLSENQQQAIFNIVDQFMKEEE